MRTMKLLILGLGTASILLGCNNDSDETESDSVNDDAVDNEQPTEDEAATEVAGVNIDDSDDLEDTASTNESDSEVVEAIETIESYEADVNISAGIDDHDPEELDLYIRAITGDNQQLHIRAEDTDRTIHTDGKTYHNNGSEWVDITGDVDFDQLHRITYASAIHVFSVLEERLELTEDEDLNVYAYEGDDGDVHELFEEFLGVSFGVVDTTNNHNQVTFQVDKDTHYITQIDFESSGEDNEGNFMLASIVKFLEFNNVDDIEAPELAE